MNFIWEVVVFLHENARSPIFVLIRVTRSMPVVHCRSRCWL